MDPSVRSAQFFRESTEGAREEMNRRADATHNSNLGGRWLPPIERE